MVHRVWWVLEEMSRDLSPKHDDGQMRRGCVRSISVGMMISKARSEGITNPSGQGPVDGEFSLQFNRFPLYVKKLSFNYHLLDYLTTAVAL